MKSFKLSSVAVLLVLALMLTACAGTPSGNEGESSSSERSEVPESSANPSESENSSGPLEEEWVSLTEDEFKWFNEQFFNVEGNCIVNSFLNCTYTDVKDISMYDLFYDCPNQSEVEISKAEKILLEKEWEEIFTDIQKVPTSYMDDMLSKYANIKLADSNKFELDMLVYLADYDAYYSMHGDTHYSPVEVKSGVKDDNGNVVLVCYRSEEEKNYQVTLKAHDNGYYFVSNVEME